MKLLKEWFKLKFKMLKTKLEILWTKVEIRILKVKHTIRGWFIRKELRKRNREIDKLNYYIKLMNFEIKQATKALEDYIKVYEEGSIKEFYKQDQKLKGIMKNIEGKYLE
jgi:hypothetical protein